MTEPLDREGRQGVREGAEPLSLRKRLGIAFVCGILLTALLVGTPPSVSILASSVVRAGAAILLVGLIGWFCRRNYYLPMKASHRDTAVLSLPDDQVYALQRSAGGLSMTTQQARIFTLGTLVPTELRERITERYTPGQRTLTQRVTIEGYIGRQEAERPQILHDPNVEKDTDAATEEAVKDPEEDSSEPSFLFPLLIPRKGMLVDNLRVAGRDGAELPVLSHRQYLQLVAQVLRTLLIIAYGRPLDQTTHKDALDAEHLALSSIMRRGPVSDDSGATAIRRLNAPNPEALNLAASLTDKLRLNYAVVASVPRPEGQRFVVSYERLITPGLKLAQRRVSFLKWAKARARLLFGARPVDISVPLENACTSQSYHLIIDGQDGVFVGQQRGSALQEYCRAHSEHNRKLWKKRQLEEPVPPPYYRFRRRAGQRYGHFYTRFFPAPSEFVIGGEKLPIVRFRFYEVPPGSIFRATIAATAATLLIWLIGFVSSRTSDPGTDVPAFLLVFPAVAAAWLGFDGSARRLLEGTLAARISLTLTALFSIAGSGLFMIFKAKLPYLQWHNPLGIQILGNTSLAWSVLIVASILNMAAIAFLYFARAWEFLHLSSRNDALSEHHEHGG